MVRIAAAIGLAVCLAPPRMVFAQEATVGETRVGSIAVRGVRRTYRLHLPPGLERDQPVPLVVVLHGAGADGALTEALTGFDRIADEHHFAVAYPDGLHRLWIYTPKSRDVRFIEAMVDALVADGTADRRRVYATGISNGAYLANQVAIDLPARFAAIAPIAGTFVALLAPRRAGPAMPVLYFHGTEDRIVGYDGVDFLTKRASSLPAEDLVRLWAKRNGCAIDPLVEQLDAVESGIRVERWTFAPRDAGDAEVVFIRIEGGGHTWPGGSFQPEILLGRVARDVPASKMIWTFFSRHARP
jgi:polyhydroxybutyrate depolymerase